MLWIDRNLQPVLPLWQKIFFCKHVRYLFGDAHFLQLDNDMLIRSGCPSPFNLVGPKQFGLVAERQCALNRIDEGGWQRRAHKAWATPCGLQPTFTWLHPNGGLYLYETAMYEPMFDRIIQHLIPIWGASDRATDESLIINQLFNDHGGYINFLPGDSNVSVQQNPGWAANPVMQSYIYHFIGKSKSYLKACQWRRFDPPELPFPGDANAKASIREWGKQPPARCDVGPISTPLHAANLLVVYPDLDKTGDW